MSRSGGCPFSFNMPTRTISNSFDLLAEESLKWLERKVSLRNECQARAQCHCLIGKFAVFCDDCPWTLALCVLPSSVAIWGVFSGLRAGESLAGADGANLVVHFCGTSAHFSRRQWQECCSSGRVAKIVIA